MHPLFKLEMKYSHQAELSAFPQSQNILDVILKIFNVRETILV